MIEGLCKCGCGKKTAIAPRNRKELGHVKNMPVAFLPGHSQGYTGDLSGQVFGRLAVLRQVIVKGVNKWECVCFCGAITFVRSSHLIKGKILSCGCLHKELVRQSFSTHRQSRPGLVTPEYRTWQDMKKRCDNIKCKDYKYYGGRGITVAPQWYSFEMFFEHMGPRPSPTHTIDRVDNSKGYAPANCRWATKQEQALNRRPKGE